jgi:hypothetical protein
LAEDETASDEALQRHRGHRVTSSLGWEVEVLDRASIRYRDDSVEAIVRYEDTMEGRFIYADTIEFPSGAGSSELESVILNRVVSANYALGAGRVDVAIPGLGWARSSDNVAIDRDASGMRTVRLEDWGVVIEDSGRRVEVPVERTGKDEYLLRWRSAKKQGKWTDDEIELWAVSGLWALGAKTVESEG